MIQYQYFNTNKGSEDRLSVSMEAQDYVYLEGLFRKIRSIVEGGGFTYATLSSGKSIFMQSSGSGNTDHAMGILVDRLNEYPCKYINKFERELENLDSVGHKLPDAELPRVSRVAPEFPTVRSIQRLIPRLVDAIVCGEANKKILVITDSKSESEQVMQAISAILPKKMMMGIGFSIGAKSLDSSEIKIKNPNGRDEVASIRIWLPQLSDFKFNNYTSEYYVFDLKNGTDSYSENTGSFARVLGDINLSDIGDVREFIDFVSDSFTDNGGVDVAKLNNLCSDYLLQMKKDPEIARELLKSRNPDDPKDKLSLISAISVITDPKNSKKMTSDDLNSVLSICNANGEIRKSASGAVVDYIANNRGAYEDLSAEGKSVCVAMLAEDDSGEMIDLVYKNWWMSCGSSSERDRVSKVLFSMTCDAVKSIFKAAGRAHALIAIPIVNKAVQFFNVDFNRAISGTCAEEILDIAINYKDMDVRRFSISILLATAYLPGVDKKYVRSIIEKLSDGLSRTSAKDQIELIFNLRKTLVEIGEEDRSLELSGHENFPFGSDKGVEWCDSILGIKGGVKKPISESIADVLQIHADAVSIRYDGMITATEKLLLKVDYVKSALRADGREYKEYKKFLDNLPDNAKTEELVSHVNHLETQGKRDSRNEDEIFENMLEKFSMLCEDDQKKILSAVGVGASELNSLNSTQKAIFVNQLSAYPQRERSRKIGTSILIDSSFLLTVVFPIISALLLIVPALFMVTFSSIDVTLAERLNGYLNSLLMVALPIAELILLVVMYRLTENAGKKMARTVKIGILYNIPIVIYDIIILILFYTGYSIGSLF